MVVIFCIMSFYVGASLASFVLTTVALSLPLSSLWASASLDGRFRQSKQSNFSPPMIGSHGSGSTGPMIGRNTAEGTLSPTYTANTRVTSGLSSPRHGEHHQMFRDLEAQGLAGAGEFTRKELG